MQGDIQIQINNFKPILVGVGGWLDYLDNNYIFLKPTFSIILTFLVQFAKNHRNDRISGPEQKPPVLMLKLKESVPRSYPLQYQSFNIGF